MVLITIIITKMTTKRVMTQHYPSVFDENKSMESYVYLRDHIKWEEGVRSRSGFTRLAKSLIMGDNNIVDEILSEAMKKLNLESQYDILGIYLNYYRDGTHYTPSHSHKGMTQLVISLGATRTLRVGTKDYIMSNGDVIIFGSSAHAIAPEPSLSDGRISIATFMQPCTTLVINPVYLTEDDLLEIVKQLSLKEK